MISYAVAEIDDLPLAGRVRAAQLPSPTVRRRIRLASRATLRDFGDELGVSPMTVLRWEQGKAKPRMDHAIAYRRLLDVVRAATRDGSSARDSC